MSTQGFINALGTLSQTFRFGLNGPMVVAVGAQKLRIVDVDNSTYLQIETGNPVDPQDVVTLSYLTALYSLLALKVSEIQTTEGVQGGGDLSANRVLKLDISGLTTDANPDAAADFMVFYDTSGAIHRKVLLQDAIEASNDIDGVRAQTWMGL